MLKFRSWILSAIAAVAFGAGISTMAPAFADEGAESADGIDRHGMVNDMELPTDPASLEHGKERFQARCSYCHRPDGRGGSSGVKLAGQKYKHGSHASQIYATIAGGRPYTKMGSFASTLSQEDILAIIAYIRTLQEDYIQDQLKEAKAGGSAESH